MNTKLIDRILKSIELILGIASLIGLILFHQEVTWSGRIAMISLFTLSFFYMASGMATIPGVDLFNKQAHQQEVNKTFLVVGPFLTGAGYAILMIFILYKSLQWDGHETMFTVGVIGSVIGTSVMLYAGIGEFKVTLLRFILIITFSLVVFLI